VRARDAIGNRCRHRGIAWGRPRGSVYLIALVAIVVGLTVGLALLASASQAVRTEGALRDQGVLRNAAEGGLEYGYWAFTSPTDQPNLPMQLTTILGDCVVRVDVVNNATQIADTIRVTSTANRKGRAVSLTRVFAATELAPDVFDYALALAGSTITSENIICGNDPAGNGDVYVNGSIIWTGAGSAVYGTAYARTTINDSLFAWAKCPNQPPLVFPAIDLAHYRAAASVIYTDSTTLKNPTFANPYTLVYVNGDLKIQGTATGTGTIAVNGQITVQNDLVYSDINQDKIALIATEQIKIAKAAKTVNGIVYARGPSQEGIIFLANSSNPLTVASGVLAGDGLTIGRELRVTHDPGLDDQMKEALHLPGHTP